MGLFGTAGHDVNYVAYLLTGQIAYNFFGDAIGTSAGVISAYSFLVKKVKFRIAILPIVKINSAVIIYSIFCSLAAVPCTLATAALPTANHEYLHLTNFRAALATCRRSSWSRSNFNVTPARSCEESPSSK